MSRQVIFIDSPDGREVPCPFCIDTREAYENVEKRVLFENLPILCDVKRDSELNKYAQKIAESVGIPGMATPSILNGTKGILASRGVAYYLGYLKGMLKKWLRF